MSLIKLEKPFTFSSWVQPACISPTVRFPTRGKIRCLQSGWGITEDGTYADSLLAVVLEYIDRNECQQLYKYEL